MHDNIPPLYSTFESFFMRRLYRRVSNCWNRPVEGIPGKVINLKERISLDNNRTFDFSGKTIKALNFGSYDYLGLSTPEGEILDAVLQSIDEDDLNQAYPISEGGVHPKVRILEKELSEFINTEDCIIYSMGYGTNTWALSALVSGSLVFSDLNNHTSLINGMRITDAHIVVF